MKKCIHDYDTIISTENLLEAWREFKKGKHKKIDVQIFERDLLSHIFSLHSELKNKIYTHSPYEHFVVSDPKRRDIHKATVRDRLLHHALYRVLYPLFDTTFIYDSYSCRIGKGTHKALERFTYFTQKVSQNYTKQCFVLKCDIKKFFASIDQVILIGILQKSIDDREVSSLLQNIIESFNSGVPGKGLPLGNLTSQLLVNIYMNEFDQYVKHVLKQKYYIRYADDFVFLGRDKEYLEVVCQKCEAFLREKLKLSFHPEKVSITTIYSGIDFLGWVHFPHHRILRTVTKRRMFRKLETKNVTPCLGLLSHGNTYDIQQYIASKYHN